MLSNIIYVLATGFLMTGSILDFHKDDPPSYFFLIGSSLFFVKASMSFISCLIERRKKLLDIYDNGFL